MQPTNDEGGTADGRVNVANRSTDIEEDVKRKGKGKRKEKKRTMTSLNHGLRPTKPDELNHRNETAPNRFWCVLLLVTPLDAVSSMKPPFFFVVVFTSTSPVVKDISPGWRRPSNHHCQVAPLFICKWQIFFIHFVIATQSSHHP